MKDFHALFTFWYVINLQVFLKSSYTQILLQVLLNN